MTAYMSAKDYDNWVRELASATKPGPKLSGVEAKLEAAEQAAKVYRAAMIALILKLQETGVAENFSAVANITSAKVAQPLVRSDMHPVYGQWLPAIRPEGEEDKEMQKLKQEETGLMM